eukprot:3450842-Rhodomonas_salina.3
MTSLLWQVRALLAGSPAEGSGMIKPKDVLLTPCPALSPRRLIPPPSRADGVVLPTVTMAQIILEVDGIDVYGMGVGDLIPLLLGEPGSQ